MAASFFFYDLETSGFNPREARIMQFAGQRTDMDLQPIGEPVNLLIKLTPDVLPDPDAVLLTGITPQQTLLEGLTEVEFLKYFYDEVVQPDTIFLGFNSIRFDDEFMRFLHYRNFYDAYEWQWANGCSRWDILDLVRLTRALRPEGIEWPFTAEGKPTNRLELLTKLNGLDHERAHDALNDVYATIAVTKLIRDKQPKLFEHVLTVRSKGDVKAIVDSGKPFMYTSGRYGSDVLHTTAAVLLAKHDQQDAAVVYDLRQDPTSFLAMDAKELAEHWRFSREPDHIKLPVKTLKYNHCPAVVPGVVHDAETLERLKLSPEVISKHLALVQTNKKSFAASVLQAATLLDEERAANQSADAKPTPVDAQLYDGFFGKRDKDMMQAARSAGAKAIVNVEFDNKCDPRLRALLPLYKARNYPKQLSAEARAEWDAFCAEKLLAGEKNSRLAGYFTRLDELTKTDSVSENQKYLLEELKLYGESIVPADAAE